MPGLGPTRRQIALAAALAAALVGALDPGGGAGTAAAGGPPGCGAASVATIAAVDGLVATDIYRNELAGTEVSADVGHITTAADLLAAVASENRAATKAAVLRIVFHPAWHIVRLRVLDRAGRLLSDIGGAYDIAPVAGPLREGGRVVGSFVMSVQDDIGVTKLETRFVGDPIGAYVGGRLVAERGASLPRAQPHGATLRVGSVEYGLVTQVDRAFPTGSVTLAILVPPPSRAIAAEPCAVVRAGEFGRVAERFAQLAVDLPRHYPAYAATVTLYGGALVFVRHGTRQLASSGGGGPAAIPAAGAVSYRGRSWTVFSFASAPDARIYVLSPPA